MAENRLSRKNDSRNRARFDSGEHRNFGHRKRQFLKFPKNVRISYVYICYVLPIAEHESDANISRPHKLYIVVAIRVT